MLQFSFQYTQSNYGNTEGSLNSVFKRGRRFTAEVSLCTRHYNPLCATNGVTYSNKCSFCTAVA
uniref:Ovomucoid n=1 Tax=Anser cygnoides TaxID=8845 RepID=A0A8B9EMF4_ANSCY